MTRQGDVLSVHPTEVAVAIDKATIVLDMLAQRAGERGDVLGREAWMVAQDAMTRASEAFTEARKVQSNRRNATGQGTIEYANEELRLRAALRYILDLLANQQTTIGVVVYERARALLENG